MTPAQTAEDSAAASSDDTDTVIARQRIPSPAILRREIPATDRAKRTVDAGRATLRDILHRRSDRFAVVVGPCSIHDPDAALDYAQKLASFAPEVSDKLFVVMRAYFEKPRTTIGWRGLINDPFLDGSYDMAEGLRVARKLLADISDLGLPTAAELLDTATPDYYADLVSFAAIGARTSESQPHRALASGIDMPVGFKNGTDGGAQIALDAMLSARSQHSYLGFDDDGNCSIVRTAGNPDTLLILRGGKKATPNFDRVSVAGAVARLSNAGLPASILVDASHANSGYDPSRQPEVAEHVLRQRNEGERSLLGIMLESNLVSGKQSVKPDRADMVYGQSITDGCLGWDETVALLRRLHESLVVRL